MIQKQPTNGYSTIANRDADTDTTATVPRVITRRSTWTTVRSWSGVIVIVAGMTMLVAGGAVWLRDSGSSYTTATEGLVVGTQGNSPCVPATGNFQLTSTTTTWGESHPLETCYYNGDNPAVRCWTKSYYYHDKDFGVLEGWHQCIPNGKWYGVGDTKLPINYCPTPCQGQHHQ